MNGFCESLFYKRPDEPCSVMIMQFVTWASISNKIMIDIHIEVQLEIKAAYTPFAMFCDIGMNSSNINMPQIPNSNQNTVTRYRRLCAPESP